MASRGNALIFTALSLTCLSVALGCGARTETLFDDGVGGASFSGYGAGGQAQGGGRPAAGSNGFAGVGNQGGFGNVAGFANVGGFPAAGSSNVGGAFPSGGTSSGGAFHTGGTSVGGAFGGFGGTLSTAGSFGTAGFGAIGGDAGAGATGGIVDLCISAAPTACNKCLCQACGSEINACASDLGCAFILLCVQQQQCQGFGCYQNSTCRGVIDQFGGLTGAPVAKVFGLASCSVTTRQGCGCN